MNSLTKIVPNVKKYSDYLFDIKKGKTPIMLSGLTDTGKSHMAYSTKFYTDKPICIVTYNEMQAKKIKKDERISNLNDIMEKKVPIIITTIEAAMQKMISKKDLYKNLITLKIGDEISIDKLKEILVSLGYERYDLIEGKVV